MALLKESYHSALRPNLQARICSRRRLDDIPDVHALDIAKRLIDYGFHPPTNYFPLNVHEALMIEPTETESKDTLDSFAGHASDRRRSKNISGFAEKSAAQCASKTS